MSRPRRLLFSRAGRPRLTVNLYAAQERVFEGGSWIDGFIGYSENTPYGKARHIKGMDGVSQMLEERQDMELALLRSLPIRSVILENTADGWDALWEHLAGNLPV